MTFYPMHWSFVRSSCLKKIQPNFFAATKLQIFNKSWTFLGESFIVLCPMFIVSCPVPNIWETHEQLSRQCLAILPEPGLLIWIFMSTNDLSKHLALQIDCTHATYCYIRLHYLRMCWQSYSCSVLFSVKTTHHSFTIGQRLL